jgi:hypothetical protein
MNNRELDQLLRTTAPPERADAYWEEFPESVVRRIRVEPVRNETGARREFSALSKWSTWLGLAGATAVVAFFVASEFRQRSQPDKQLLALRTCYRQTADLFPRQLEAVILDADGPQLQLSDTPDVPASPPLFVRICPPSSRCTTVVSFSGRTIHVSGEEFEILANGAGEIFLMTKKGVWSSGESPVKGGGWRFESGWLERSL